MVYTRGFNGKKMGKQVSLLHYHNDTGTGEEIAVFISTGSGGNFTGKEEYRL